MQNPKCDFKACACHNKKPGFFMWYYHDLGYTWYEVPKCASSAIKQMFKKKITRRDEGKQVAGYETVAVVRNPFDRMVSNYVMWTSSRKSRLKSMCGGKTPPDTFASFVEFALRYDNHHWRPQCDFIPHWVTHLIYLEDFCDEITVLFGDEARLPEKKVGKTKHGPYWEYYRTPQIDTVTTMFARDLARFGYRYGDEV